MRILHIGEYVKGGVATYIRTVIQHQQKNHAVYLALSGYNSEKTWPLPEERIHYYTYKRNLSCTLQAIISIYKIIKIVKPDIVHIHSSWAGLYARILYFFVPKNIKIVYCAHGWAFLMDVSIWKKQMYAFIERVLSYKTDAIINISKFELHKAVEYKIAPKKLILIQNGVYESLNNKAAIKFCDNIVNLLFVGRFDRSKGIDVLLGFLQKKTYEHLHVYIIGDSVVDNIDLVFPANTTLLGWVDNNLIDNYYAACDAVIMPSRWEGFGLTAIEAMRNRKAVIASNRCALPELVVDGYNGYIFDLDSLQELDRILLSLDKHELKKMGSNGYQFYKSQFTARHMNAKIDVLYNDLMK
ncbi:glycosyltransferase [Sporomusa sphaeroides DSM 2875]|uniref:glycosyltransferase n=1 Tax=Sporomusa sphaeroides TaxID=47679 RepID=UPI00202F0464|nr:glycosyltransferase [Sporomusa sphaeroides]MCM0758041.1 glycosyltransferase [Sporomusa sphaeroides DSM 2875]